MRPHLSPTDWSGFSDGFRSALDPFKPVPDLRGNEVPTTFDDSGSASETADRAGAEREDVAV
jgi:hypothetical protein